MRLLIATTNPDKLREIRAILGALPLELLSLRDFPPVVEPDESGATFQENARLKALYYDAALLGRDSADPRACTVAEDSGLVIDLLDGEPGVHSARFLRPDATYAERFDEIYRRLAQRPGASRTARFVCAACVVRAGEVIHETTGVVEGLVAPEPRGVRGFGYDPIFYYPPYDRTLGEATDEQKLRIAHRGRAFRSLGEWLSRQVGGGRV